MCGSMWFDLFVRLIVCLKLKLYGREMWQHGVRLKFQQIVARVVG